jgi:hypothetical protein
MAPLTLLLVDQRGQYRKAGPHVDIGAFEGALQVPSPCNAGTALSFDGVDDYVRIPGFLANAPTTEVTVEFWQKVTAAAIQSTFCQSLYVPGSIFNAHVPYNNGTVYWDFGDIAGNAGRLSYTPSVSLVGTWQHFALVASQSGNYMRIYRNGVLEASKTGMTPLVRANLDLILGGAFVGVPYGGLLDEFRIWNVARSQADIQATMYHALPLPQSGLVAYWRFDEGPSVTAGDSSGYGNTGTLVNGPLWISSTAPFSPCLSVDRSGANVIISWPSPSTGYVLQESDDLVHWTNVTLPVLDDNITQTVTAKADQAKKFYRLRQ